MSRRALAPPLIALSPGTLSAAGAAVFIASVRRALGAGLGAVLLREPELTDGAALSLARAVGGLCKEAGAWFGVHDRAHFVGAAGASALHLGFRSLPPEAARRVVGPHVSIGLSSHAGDEREHEMGADYLFHGPVLDTPSKHGLLEPVGFDGLRAAAERTDLPVWAIGGIQPEHARPALAAGAAGIAVLGGIFGARDPAASVRAYQAELGAARGGPR